MDSDRHLIVIRGNSATGKTTSARALQLAMGRGTANVGQDHFRRIVLREHDVPGGANIALIEHTVRQCLSLGWHTIVEGIFYEAHYGDMLRGLLTSHSGPSHVFYLDLPLGDTMLRHKQRPLSAEVPSERLRDWYRPQDLLGVDGERILDADHSVEELVRVVTASVGPITPRADVGGEE